MHHAERRGGVGVVTRADERHRPRVQRTETGSRAGSPASGSAPSRSANDTGRTGRAR